LDGHGITAVLSNWTVNLATTELVLLQQNDKFGHFRTAFTSLALNPAASVFTLLAAVYKQLHFEET
jgi:hypothetical protein